jgi:hypothetical protein
MRSGAGASIGERFQHQRWRMQQRLDNGIGITGVSEVSQAKAPKALLRKPLKWETFHRSQSAYVCVSLRVESALLRFRALALTFFHQKLRSCREQRPGVIERRHRVFERVRVPDAVA